MISVSSSRRTFLKGDAGRLRTAARNRGDREDVSSLRRYLRETSVTRGVVIGVSFALSAVSKPRKARQGGVKLYLDDEVEDLGAPS